jgi:thioredoxin reductase (NADPH)
MEWITTYDVAIVGGGPAGASAAIFTARAGLRTALVDADQSITRRALIKNHLGLPDAITGPELVDRGKQHATACGAELITTKATELRAGAGGLMLHGESGRDVEARHVILCLGANPELARLAGARIVAGTEPRIKEIVAVDAQGQSSIPGVWAAGTCAGTSVHTIITAGDGARVAINVISAIKGERHVDHDVLPAPGR